MDEQILQRIADELQGTCKSVAQVLDYLGLDLDPSDVEDALLGLNIEQCPGCGWWFESGELVSDDGDVVGCEQCRGKGNT